MMGCVSLASGNRLADDDKESVEYQHVDCETRTHKRLRLVIDILERRIRVRARQLYEQRGRQEGMALEDWIRAEIDILRSSILARLWSAGRLLEVVQEPESGQIYSKPDQTRPEQAVVEKTRSIGRHEGSV